MKKILLLCCLALLSAAALAQANGADSADRQQIAAFIDAWHDDAAHARLAYFDKMASDGVYIGTDKTELWGRDAFRQWASKFFERGSAWTFKSTRRNIYLSADRKFIWFDELLDTQMGVCQASGVIGRTEHGFEIKHYQLSIAIPNDIARKVTAMVKQFEAVTPAKQAAR